MAIKKYDVFLSFRGDLRNKFIGYLYAELKHQGFQPFFDKENIQNGDSIDEKIKDAIQYSRSAIVVFSHNYASSNICIDELLLIFERNRTSSRYFVIPIFYDVEAADVKYQLGKFGEGFEHVKECDTEDKVQEWRAACTEAGRIFGDEIKEYDPRMESKIIEDIVASFEQKFSENYRRRWLKMWKFFRVLVLLIITIIVRVAVNASFTPSSLNEDYAIIIHLPLQFGSKSSTPRLRMQPLRLTE